MTDSAERTRDLLGRAIYDPGRLTEREGLIGDADDLEPLHVMQARACMAALLSDPTLLVDLALEAGGLEQVGMYADPSNPNVTNSGWVGIYDLDPTPFLEVDPDDEFPDWMEPVYRRKEKTEP